MTRFACWLALASTATLLLSDSTSGHSTTHSSTISRKLFVENGRRLLKNCIKSDAGRELRDRAIARRLALLEDVHVGRRLDAATALATDHESNRTGLTANTSSSELFTGTPVCLLEPEVPEGPYYVSGELIRSDIREDQPGIDLYVDLQFIDVNTCSPVSELYVDFWHANATGVYSGIVASTNGNSDDASNVDTTYHRGLSPTNSNGSVSFITKFPGLYAGRTTHIHIMTHSEGTLLDNGTYSGGRVAHIGQIFFDQSLITEVQVTGAYAQNTNPMTPNEDDRRALESAADDFDPFVQYVRLGDNVEDGLLSWISIGVDMTNDNSVTAAGRFTGDGGVSTPGGGTATNSRPGPVVESTNVSDASGGAANEGVKVGQLGGWIVTGLLLLHVLVLP
ncbi:hypothetical protein PHMEG_00017837 [Phytophthora megakarya]|uniref:Intradiol ring-cleavage dioxygenases domain-containing protein n=1 Tax=Phytophthora megakarya TaxID=4795 RepID=A0A225VVA8_9STRA|nr:hypothetical protein PHMEG_00017837 [Phytophthora megakarya]